MVIRRPDFVRRPTFLRRRDRFSLLRRSFEARSSTTGLRRERRRGDRILFFAYLGERRAAIDQILPGVGERFTEVAGPFDAVGEPGNDIGAAFTEGGETFTPGGNTFTGLGAGFREVAEKSDDGGGGFTERGQSFEDGGTESFDRCGTLEQASARRLADSGH